MTILGDLPVILLDRRVSMNTGTPSEGATWHATLDGWDSAPFISRDLNAELAHGNVWQPGFVGPRSLTLRGWLVPTSPGLGELRRLRDLIVDFVNDPTREISLLVRETVGGTEIERTVTVRRAEGPEFAFEGCDRLRFAMGFVATDPRRYRSDAGITLTGDTAPWVNFASTDESTSSTVTLTVPFGSTTGDMLLAFFDIADGDVNNAPAGWVLLVGQAHSGTRRSFLYRRSAGGAEPGSYNWGLDTSTQWAGTMMRIMGSDLTVATAVSTPPASATLAWPAITPGMPRALLLQMAGMNVSQATANNLVAPSNGVEVVAFGDAAGSGDNAAVYVAARRRLTDDPPEEWNPENVEQESTSTSIGYTAVAAVIPPAKGPTLIVTGGTAPVGATVSWVGPSQIPGLVQVLNRGRHVALDALNLGATDSVVVDIGAHRASIRGEATTEALLSDNQWWDLTPGESLITELRSSDNGTVDEVNRPTFDRGRGWRITSLAGGAHWALSEFAGVTAGEQYSGRAAFRSAGTNRSVRIGVEWRSSSAGFLSVSTSGAFLEITDAWVDIAATFTAPSGAEIARLRPEILDSVVGEIHHVDGILLRQGADNTRSRHANQIDLLGVSSAQMRWSEADW